MGWLRQVNKKGAFIFYFPEGWVSLSYSSEAGRLTRLALCRHLLA